MNTGMTNPAPARRRWLARFLRPARGVGQASPTKALGNEGERLAAGHLRKLGYRVVARNMVLGHAEADLVCLTPDRRTIVVVEVKTRRITIPRSAAGQSAGARTPEAAITVHKRGKLRQLARSLATRRRWAGRPVRIDVIAIDVPPDGPPRLRHHEDAVR